jgi:hypothetical protein
MYIKNFTALAAAFAFATSVFAQNQICEQAQKDFAATKDAAEKGFQAEKDKADQNLKEGQQNYSSCAEGTISFMDERWVMKIPEFTSKPQKMSMDLPQVTLKTKEISMDLPSVTCGTGVIGHQPVTICSGPSWEKPIPECKIEMREVIGTRCETKMTTNKVVLGVPEVKMDRTEWVLNIPEVTMKDQEWKFKTIKIKWNAGCTGGQECAKKCQGIMDNSTTEYNGRIAPASTQLRKNIASGSHNLNQCFRQTIVAQREAFVAQYDAGIKSLQTSIDQLGAAGAADSIPGLKSQRDDLIQKKAELETQMNNSIKQIDEGEEKLMKDIAGN